MRDNLQNPLVLSDTGGFLVTPYQLHRNKNF